jgi:hypothetical protein
MRKTHETAEKKATEKQVVEEAIGRFYQELSEIRRIGKCKTCVCLCETISDLRNALSEIDRDKFEKIRLEVEEWMAECEKAKLHGCLGCNPCLPVKPFVRFHEVSSVKP